MIERWHPGKALLLRQFDGARLRFVKIGTVQEHFATETANRVHFDIRRGHRHHDQRFQP
ncbi:hypothetical protein D3C81_2177150 [compost metagenome]